MAAVKWCSTPSPYVMVVPSDFSSFSARAEDQPLKVFVLVGQSNMQGHAHVRTLEHLGMDPETEPLLRKIQGADGKARIQENEPLPRARGSYVEKPTLVL